MNVLFVTCKVSNTKNFQGLLVNESNEKTFQIIITLLCKLIFVMTKKNRMKNSYFIVINKKAQQRIQWLGNEGAVWIVEQFCWEVFLCFLEWRFYAFLEWCFYAFLEWRFYAFSKWCIYAFPKIPKLCPFYVFSSNFPWNYAFFVDLKISKINIFE